MRWKIPAAIPVDWRYRPLESATVTVRRLDDGHVEQRIEHQELRGVRPEMMLWYLEHIGEELTFRGTRAIGYRFWHPADHIFFERQGAFGAGDRWHIVEAFQAQRRFLMSGVFDVLKVDETGFQMELRVAGRRVAMMDEQWQRTPDGMRWTVVQTLGASGPVLRTIASLVVHFKHEMMFKAWPRHNVEEVGSLPHFLPELYATRGRG